MNTNTENGSGAADPNGVAVTDEPLDPQLDNPQLNNQIPLIGFPQHVHIYHHHDYSGKEKPNNNTNTNSKKLEEAKENINASVTSTVEALHNLFQKHINFKFGPIKKSKDQSKKEDSTSNEDTNESKSDAWTEEVDLGPPEKKIWHGFDGIAVMSFGVAIPSLMMLLTAMSCYQRITLMLLNHPFETLLEILMVAMIPIAILSSWKFYCKNNYRFNIVRGSILGIAIGSGLMTAGFCTEA